MKISARRLTRIVREAARDVHSRFDVSDVQADMDDDDPTMLPSDAASEIDEDASLDGNVASDDASYALGDIAARIEFLKKNYEQQITANAKAMQALDDLRIYVADAARTIEGLAQDSR
jgi:uncharacterized protein YajQ (UPF0234 family)